MFDETTGEILELALADGTPLYEQGSGDVFGGTLDLVTNSFTAAGGDGFDEFAMFTPFDTGVAYSDALRGFIENPLGGLVSAADYPEGGLGRITSIPEPNALAMLVAGALLLRGAARRMMGRSESLLATR